MNKPLYGQRINYADPQSRQQALAYQLMQQGASTRPVHTPLEGIARALQAGVGGYFSHEADTEQKAKDKDRQMTLARALQAGQGVTDAPGPNIDGSAGVNLPPDPKMMAAILAGNPQTVDMGLNLGLQDIQYNRQRADIKADKQDDREYQGAIRKEDRGFRLEDMYLQQNFQREMQALQQARATGNMEAAQQHAINLARMQQEFTAGENAKNRETQLQAAVPAQVLTGLKIQEKQKEIEDATKAKTESVVSVDRMIRSIDDLSSHPGLEGTVGVSFGQRHIPGTDAASFDAKLETLKSQAFLPMVAQLKGMGQLSDAEGKKLTAAIGALDPRMSEKEFRSSLQEIKGDLESARKRMGAPAAPTVDRPAAAVAAGNLPPLPGGFQLVQ